jgi:hypothetical protein
MAMFEQPTSFGPPTRHPSTFDPLPQHFLGQRQVTQTSPKFP